VNNKKVSFTDTEDENPITDSGDESDEVVRVEDKKDEDVSEKSNSSKLKCNLSTVKEYFSWIYLFWSIGIDEVTMSCGLDTQIYLTFMNYSAWFFFVTACITCGVLLPAFHQ